MRKLCYRVKKQIRKDLIYINLVLPGWCTDKVLGLVAKIGDTQYAACNIYQNYFN